MSTGEILVGQPNLNALYRMSDVNDASGNGRTLTNHGTTTFALGKFGNGAVFDNDSSKYLSRSTDLGLDCANGPITICFWTKITTAPSGDTYGFFAIKSAADSQSFSLSYRDSGGTKTLRLFWGYNTDETVSLSVTQTLTAGKWYHIAVIMRTNNALDLYLNGNLLGTATQTANSPSDTFTYIGIGCGSGTGRYGALNGMIDDFAAFAEVKSAVWVRQVYANGMGRLNQAQIWGGCI